MDENTKTIDPIQAEPVEVIAEVPSVSTPPAFSHLPLAGEESTEVPVEATEPIVEESKPDPVVILDDAEIPVGGTKTEEVPVVSETLPNSNSEEKEEPKVIIETPVVEMKPKEAEIPPVQAEAKPLPKIEEAKPIVVSQAPVVAQTPVSEPKLTPVMAHVPEPVTSPHISPLEALGARFMANMKRARELLVKARAALSLRRKKKVEKMMTLFLMKTKINNKNVRDLLHVTDDTATSYLNAMLKEGKIKREGKGNQIYYTKI